MRDFSFDRDQAAGAAEVAKLPPRAMALDRGRTTYHGKPCKGCGGTLRWTASYGCCACQRARQAATKRDRKGEKQTIAALLGSWSR